MPHLSLKMKQTKSTLLTHKHMTAHYAPNTQTHDRSLTWFSTTTKSDINIIETEKIYAPNTQTHDRSVTCFSTATLILKKMAGYTMGTNIHS